MNIYIKSQDGKKLIIPENVIQIGGTKNDCIITNYKNADILLGKYKDAEQANNVFCYIADNIINPNSKSIEKDRVYIDLFELQKQMETNILF